VTVLSSAPKIQSYSCPNCSYPLAGFSKENRCGKCFYPLTIDCTTCSTKNYLSFENCVTCGTNFRLAGIDYYQTRLTTTNTDLDRLFRQIQVYRQTLLQIEIFSIALYSVVTFSTILAFFRLPLSVALVLSVTGYVLSSLLIKLLVYPLLFRRAHFSPEKDLPYYRQQLLALREQQATTTRSLYFYQRSWQKFSHKNTVSDQSNPINSNITN
jgi:hypothetical protein